MSGGNYVGYDPGLAIPPGYLANAGRVIQSLSNLRSDYANTALLIPFDDTIPQIGEGFEFFTLNFVPSAVGNRVRLQSFVNCSHNVAGGATIISAIFRGGVANALVAGTFSISSSNNLVQVAEEYEYIAADVLPVTFSVRMGMSVAGTMYINGRLAGALMGGSYISYLKLEEFSS